MAFDLHTAGVFEALLERWDGEEAVIRYDRDSGAWMFVCVHSTALGPAGGGTRLRVYETPGDGLADALRLSQAMTVKMAVADCGRGGGKAVLAVPALPTGDARRSLLLRYAELVTALGGTYRTAGDMNVPGYDPAKFNFANTADPVNKKINTSLFSDPAPLTLGKAAIRYGQLRGFAERRERPLRPAEAGR